MASAGAVYIGGDLTQIPAERLAQAGMIDEAAKANLFSAVLKESGLKAPEPGKVLYSGIVFKEGHVNTKFEIRLLRLRIDKDWVPMLEYAKPEAPQEVLADYHLQSFTFVPTKIARKEHVISWRMDVTGVSIGKGKHDKLVVAFKNMDECHLWQAAFSLCKNPKKHAAELKDRQLAEESARAEAVRRAEEQHEQEQEAMRTAALELAISQSIQLMSAGDDASQAKAVADKAAEEAEAARLVMEQEQREEEEARARMLKEQAEAEEAQRLLEKEAAEAEAARISMLKEEQEAEAARLVMEKEIMEAEQAKAKFDKEHAEFVAAAASHAKEFEEAEAAARHLAAVRAAFSDALPGGNLLEIAQLQKEVAAAERAWEKESEEAKGALERMIKEEEEAKAAQAALEKEREEASAATLAHAAEETEAAAARAAYEKEEAERAEAQKAYEKEKSEADSATGDYEREAAEAEAARALHLQRQKEADDAKALQQQKEAELEAVTAAETMRLKVEIEALDRQKAQEAAKAQVKPAVDPKKASEAEAFVAAGGGLNKYMRAKLINGKWHDPRPKTVKMVGTQIAWDKRSFQVVGAKLGGSQMLRANNPGSAADLAINFHCTLSGVPAGQDHLDFQAPSKEVAEKWVIGILSSIGKLP